MHRDRVYGLRLVAAVVDREAEMTEPGAVLEAVHMAIADLAAVPGCGPVVTRRSIWRTLV